ncbi:SDR family oxidoreductase [Glaciimonas sp. CA11.2]|uniref:SDR family NAD(P)-dependent oxidoreductase n=1 Tax=unclassified Glaciimonas TaxID=2644401 RepID=UPI002AB39E5E|nr:MULTISPECIES: SDR family oxidoreductase [unclassified Glaciimonas]MDY7548424.1 SDR family oxidoreductase [Glaciimonas sp. CA11.2]MEB0010426.1 SDR family oxidoreductase [Glaciimonas sp. Cout2]MEB0083971.1 SDR family oxidoreductase [Glaciimonas sp. Gout2]MEB0164669.1 SDR family oxidoreductase [Glaciimonas sp. CA11.2]
MKQSCIIVTGASRGIGAAIAESLAEAGFMVGCLSRSGDLPHRPDASEQARQRWLSAACDVTNASQVRAAIADIQSRCSVPIAGLVNNAGIHMEGKSASLPLEEFDKVMQTNANSVVIGSQSVFPYLREQGGLIVNIGSFFDKMGVKRNLAYCASKAAVGAITRCLAVEWASVGVRVLNVAPGYIVTDLNRASMSEGPLRTFLEKRIPNGAPGTADDVGALVALLFAMPGGFMSGETIYIDGAQGVAH